jgi:hypothetical protein
MSSRMMAGVVVDFKSAPECLARPTRKACALELLHE